MSDKKNDKFGDEVKELESISAKVKLNEDQPICVRLDGKAFHTFTKGLKRPYDERLSSAMIQTMNYLVEKTNAKIGYTQSDEITLIYYNFNDYQEVMYGARVQKLTSILSSMASVKFNDIVQKTIPEKKDNFAFFDCRVWNVPTLKEAADVLIWRQDDAIKNSISMAAHAEFGHNKTNNKNSTDKIEMLKEKDIDWMSYPEFFKSGTYAVRKTIELPMPEELKSYQGNENKEIYVRSIIDNFHFKRLKNIENVVDFIFDPIKNEYKKSIEFKKQKKAKNG